MLLLFLLLIHHTLASSCGSLVTYRQYSTLLNSAPSCFKHGCNSNSEVTSISDQCLPEASCFNVWKLFTDQFHQNWCSSCHSDVACRISGWPVLNATQMCEVIPHASLFFGNGGCCTSGNEPFELADWIGTLCNQSEWRSPFAHYNDMAKDDWAEWIQPWNWTVQARNSTSDVQKASKAVKCQHPSRYIGLLFVDNFAAVLGIILLGLFKSLAISRSAQDRRNLVWRFLASKPGPVTQSILMGFVTAGINVVMNFANAYKIHHYSGYHHVPLVRLWLLFCSRPTLNWLPVVLGLPFSGLFQNIHARDTWLDIASTAAISELLMQGFGTFTFWNATHLGVKRHFYLRNTLRQFWHGTNAHQMYIGSLLWVMGCLVIIPTWLFVLAFIVQLRRIIATLGNAGRRTRTRLWAFLVVVLWTTPSRIVPAATRQRLRRRYDAFAARVNQRLRRGFAPLGRPSRRVAALYAAWRARHPARPRDPQARMREWYARVPIAMVFALLLGLADYIAQILFWDGFVKAEGIRYCPPDQVIPEIVSIWTTGSIAAVLFTFLGN